MRKNKYLLNNSIIPYGFYLIRYIKSLKSFFTTFFYMILSFRRLATVISLASTLILMVFSSQAQNYRYALFAGDTVVLNVTGIQAGIQWQESKDSINWSDIYGATDSTEIIITDTSYSGKRFFRAKDIDPLCPFKISYSSVIRHKVLDSIQQIQIGDWFRGGVVFYTDSNGHGLIAPVSDQSSSCQWGCNGTSITGATSTTDGAANTAAIIAFHDGLTNYYGNPTQCNNANNGTVAAKLCDTITINGYNDWYLPAKDEMNLLYLKKNYVGGFANYSYASWNSTEYLSYSAWVQNYFNGNQSKYFKYSNLYVRCIKSYAPGISYDKTYCSATISNQPETVSITSQPDSKVICLGNSVNFSISVSGTTPYYYQWLKNGDTVVGATSNTLNISGSAISDEAFYSCRVRNLCRSHSSDSAVLKVINTSVTKLPFKTYVRAQLSWNKRIGYKYAIFLKQTSSGSENPSDNVSYTANDSSEAGSQIGNTGWYCVYNGTDSTVLIKGLSPTTTYSAMVTEYTGTTGNEQYDSLVTGSCNPLVFTTVYATPAKQATNLYFSNINATSFSISCNKGNGTQRVIFIASASTGRAAPSNNTTYTANTAFGSGTQTGTNGWYCVFNGTDSSVTVSNLSANTTYRVMVCEYNGTTGTEQYNADSVNTNLVNQITDFITPTDQSNNIKFSGNSTTSTTINWTNGNGNNRVVFVNEGNSGTALPVKHTAYTAGTSFGSGTQIGNSGWFAVYNGSGNSVTITGLTMNTTYRVMVCEYNGTAGRESYNPDTSTDNPVNIVPIPATQAHSITFSHILFNAVSISCNKGNGTQRAIFIASAGTGKAAPSNNTTYTADTAFGSGTQTGTSGWYCVYNGTDSAVTVSNLSPNTTYRFMVCEYNGNAGKEQYNIYTSLINPANQTTDYAVPSIQASNFTFTELSTVSFLASWTNGNGTERIVFMCECDDGNPSPVNNTSYLANDTFGSGSQINSSGWYSVYKGTNDSVMIQGIVPNTIYRIMVCEFNGTSGKEKYNLTPALNNPFNYEPKPSRQASSITFTNISNYNLTTNWIIGNGKNRVVFMKEGILGDAFPVANSTYIASSNFGSGTQINSSGWYCVYNGAGNSATVGGLTPHKEYRFKVCEYNGSNGNEQYNTISEYNNPASVSTIEIQPVCMVTVDTITWKNKIVWEKPSSIGNYSGFNIYKETTTNNYSMIGSINYDSMPQFIDSNSNPEATGYKYKLSIFDTTGIESYLSPYHKTMNLTISSTGSTMGLRWDAYEDESENFVPAMYFIFRGSSPNSISLFDSVSGSFTSYNDNNIFSLYYYLVGVRNPAGCDIYRSSKPFISFSNKKNNSSLIGIKENQAKYDYSIIPNPFHNSTILRFPNPNQTNYNFTLYNATGKIVRVIKKITSDQVEIKRADLSKGIYFFTLNGEKIINGKIVVE